MTPAHLLLPLVLSVATAAPEYKLQSAPTKTVQATMTYDVCADKLQAKEWLLFAPVLPTTAGQTEVTSQMTPVAKEIAELSDLKRPLLLARVPADNDERKQAGQCEGGLSGQALVAAAHAVSTRRESARRSKISRSPIARRHYVPSATSVLTAMASKRGRRNTISFAVKTSHEIDFARRVFTTIRKAFTYVYQPEMDRTPPAVCQVGKSDCGGLSNLFVATLRSQGIPARTLAGRWAISADPNEKLNGHEYYQYHVKAEFFATGVGWVPVDMASGILHDRSREGLYYFGYDPGDFLTQHIDGNLEVDSIHFGKQRIVVLQRPAYWVTGTGTLDDVKVTESWTVSSVAR